MKILKKFLYTSLVTISCTIINFSAIQPAYSQGPLGALGGIAGGGVLIAIKKDTADILTGIQTLPQYISAYFQPLFLYATSWLAEDDKADGLLATYQNAIATVNRDAMQNRRMQDAATMELTKTFLKNGSFNRQSLTLPEFANGLSYSVFFGKGVKIDTTQDQKTRPEELMKDYVRNLTGANFLIYQPAPIKGSKIPPNSYTFFYYSVAAIQSFNSHILSQLLTVPDKNGQSQREFLLNQASSSSWFKQLGSEKLGLVIRHILMYDSQIYATLSRLESLQKDHLAATAMTNTLLMFIASQQVGAPLSNSRTGGGNLAPAAPVISASCPSWPCTNSPNSP
ncbi:MAG: hypothetical protein ACYCQI_01845 [Gammaproteobacteria bacterium]